MNMKRFTVIFLLLIIIQFATPRYVDNDYYDYSDDDDGPYITKRQLKERDDEDSSESSDSDSYEYEGENDNYDRSETPKETRVPSSPIHVQALKQKTKETRIIPENADNHIHSDGPIDNSLPQTHEYPSNHNHVIFKDENIAGMPRTQPDLAISDLLNEGNFKESPAQFTVADLNGMSQTTTKDVLSNQNLQTGSPTKVLEDEYLNTETEQDVKNQQSPPIIPREKGFTDITSSEQSSESQEIQHIINEILEILHTKENTTSMQSSLKDSDHGTVMFNDNNETVRTHLNPFPITPEKLPGEINKNPVLPIRPINDQVQNATNDKNASEQVEDDPIFQTVVDNQNEDNKLASVSDSQRRFTALKPILIQTNLSVPNHTSKVALKSKPVLATQTGKSNNTDEIRLSVVSDPNLQEDPPKPNQILDKKDNLRSRLFPKTHRRGNALSLKAAQHQKFFQPVHVPLTQDVEHNVRPILPALDTDTAESTVKSNPERIGMTSNADKQVSKVPPTIHQDYTKNTTPSTEQTYSTSKSRSKWSGIQMPFHMQLDEKIDIDLDEQFQNTQDGGRAEQDTPVSSKDEINEQRQPRSVYFPLSHETGSTRTRSGRGVGTGKHHGYRMVREDAKRDAERAQITKADRENLLRIMSAVDIIKNQLDEMDLSKRIDKGTGADSTVVQEKTHQELDLKDSKKTPIVETRGKENDNQKQGNDTDSATQNHIDDNTHTSSNKSERTSNDIYHSRKEEKRSLRELPSDNKHVPKESTLSVGSKPDPSGKSTGSDAPVDSMHLCISETSSKHNMVFPLDGKQLEATAKELQTIHKNLHSLATKLEKGLNTMLDQVTDFSNMEETDIKANRDKIFMLQTSMTNKFDELQANISGIMDSQMKQTSVLNESLANLHSALKRIGQFQISQSGIDSYSEGINANTTAIDDSAYTEKSNRNVSKHLVENGLDMEVPRQTMNKLFSIENYIDQLYNASLNPDTTTQLDKGEHSLTNTRNEGNPTFNTDQMHTIGVIDGLTNKTDTGKQNESSNLQRPQGLTLTNDTLLTNNPLAQAIYDQGENIPNHSRHNVTQLKDGGNSRTDSSNGSFNHKSIDNLWNNLNHIQEEIAVLKNTVNNGNVLDHNSTDSITTKEAQVVDRRPVVSSQTTGSGSQYSTSTKGLWPPHHRLKFDKKLVKTNAEMPFGVKNEKKNNDNEILEEIEKEIENDVTNHKRISNTENKLSIKRKRQLLQKLLSLKQKAARNHLVKLDKRDVDSSEVFMRRQQHRNRIQRSKQNTANKPHTKYQFHNDHSILQKFKSNPERHNGKHTKA